MEQGLFNSRRVHHFNKWVESKAIYREEANARSKNGKNENIAAAVKQKKYPDRIT